MLHQNRDEKNSFLCEIGQKPGQWKCWWTTSDEREPFDVGPKSPSKIQIDAKTANKLRIGQQILSALLRRQAALEREAADKFIRDAAAEVSIR